MNKFPNKHCEQINKLYIQENSIETLPTKENLIKSMNSLIKKRHDKLIHKSFENIHDSDSYISTYNTQ